MQRKTFFIIALMIITKCKAVKNFFILRQGDSGLYCVFPMKIIVSA